MFSLSLHFKINTFASKSIFKRELVSNKNRFSKKSKDAQLYIDPVIKVNRGPSQCISCNFESRSNDDDNTTSGTYRFKIHTNGKYILPHEVCHVPVAFEQWFISGIGFQTWNSPDTWYFFIFKVLFSIFIFVVLKNDCNWQNILRRDINVFKNVRRFRNFKYFF